MIGVLTQYNAEKCNGNGLTLLVMVLARGNVVD